MDDKLQTVARFIEKHNITAKVRRVDTNPNMDADAEWMRSASHWRVTFSFQKRRMTVPYSMGSAHTQPPTAKEVLDCLADDSAGLENRASFEEWREDYGYDTDSRKAERIYNTVVKQSERLHKLLGDELYDELLWKTERD